MSSANLIGGRLAIGVAAALACGGQITDCP